MNGILLTAIYQESKNVDYFINETKTLAKTIDIEIVEVFSQKVRRRHPATYLHSGKIDEVLAYIEANDIELVIIQEEISAAVERNLSKKFGVKVIDRTNIILDIFFTNAQSKLAKNQIQIARLQYNLSKVIGSYSNLEKQGSSAVSRSSGESKAELDKRRIRDQINGLKKEIDSAKAIRDNKRQKRRDSQEPIISIVGYTNVGKSTFLNSLTTENRQILAKNQLFATLDTSVRNISYKDFGSFLLVDTVGFVSNLPHHLVEAFASTFEEILESDLIIHMQDASDPYYSVHNQIVVDTLKSLNAADIPIIEVNNKCDLTDEIIEGINISAKDTVGYDNLFLHIVETLNVNRKLCKMFIDYNNMSIYYNLKKSFKLEHVNISENGVELSIYLNEQELNKYIKFIVE